jgi:hypothetical protein
MVSCWLLQKLSSLVLGWRGIVRSVLGSQGCRGATLVARGGSSYSPGAVDADYSLSPPKTVCAWWTPTSYKWWACSAEHSGSKEVDLEKQSPILRCECRAYGMNGSGWVCLYRHPLGYRVTSQLYLALPSFGALHGGPNISPNRVGSRLRVIQSLRRAPQ